jgi:hypothetical protein
MEIIKRTNPVITTKTTAKKATVKKKTTTKKSSTSKTSAKKTSIKVVKPSVKIVTPELIGKILDALGLKSFSRPFAGLIDQGDFGTVGTYIPLYQGELEKLPKELRENAYEIAEGRYGLICHLPRTFDSPDGGKVVSMKEIKDKKGNTLRAEYTTDLGNTMVATHELRLMKLFTYVKNKKLPVSVVKE